MSVTDDTDFEVISNPDTLTTATKVEGDKLSVSLTQGSTADELLITLTPPHVPSGHGEIQKRRAPVDFVLNIDISGSMADEAPIPGESGGFLPLIGRCPFNH